MHIVKLSTWNKIWHVQTVVFTFRCVLCDIQSTAACWSDSKQILQEIARASRCPGTNQVI